MQSDHYALYVGDVLNLVKSTCVKLDRFAEIVNAGVIASHGTASVDNYDPRSWKYFQNIAGRYHSTDTPMVVKSHDTRQEIVFNKNNLKLHAATRLAYLPGEVLHDDLLNRYPQQDLLIRSILFAPEHAGFIDEVIAAEDGYLCYYDDSLIESNEHNLLAQVQEWIYTHLFRWYNPGFNLTDEFYACAFMSHLYMLLVQLVLNLRLQACKSNEAHSFHIRQYLASHGGLDVHYENLTKEQALYLYRNLAYIEQNAGKKSVFADLVANLLTKRGLPIYEYTTRHDNSNTFGDESTHNHVLFYRKALNLTEDPNTVRQYTIERMLEQIKELAPDNEKHHQYFAEDMENALKYSSSATTYTKMVESVVMDYSKYAPYPLEAILLNHWIHWGLQGRYSCLVDVEVPTTKKNIQLTTDQVLILFYYSLCKSAGVTLERLPSVEYFRVVRDEPVTPEEIRSKTDARYLREEVIDRVLATLVTPPSTISSVEEFYQLCHAIYRSTWEQSEIMHRHHAGHAQAAVEVASHLLYQDGRDHIELGMDYAQWLASLNLDYSSYSASAFFELAQTLMLSATGLATHKSIDIKQVQRSMLEIMKQLTSYSVLYLSDTEDSAVEYVANPAVGPLEVISCDRDHLYIENAIHEVLSDTVTEAFIDDATTLDNPVVITWGHELSQSKIEQVVDGLLKDRSLILEVGVMEIMPDEVLSSSSSDPGFSALSPAQLHQLAQAVWPA